MVKICTLYDTFFVGLHKHGLWLAAGTKKQTAVFKAHSVCFSVSYLSVLSGNSKRKDFTVVFHASVFLKAFQNLFSNRVQFLHIILLELFCKEVI